MLYSNVDYDWYCGMLYTHLLGLCMTHEVGVAGLLSVIWLRADQCSSLFVTHPLLLTVGVQGHTWMGL